VSAREDCLKRLEQLVGPSLVEAWLKKPRPELDGMSGARLLNFEPDRLLLHLKLLTGEIDDLFADPIIDRPAQLRRASDAQRVLDLLGEIFGDDVERGKA
jgi:hypothetical protein